MDLQTVKKTVPDLFIYRGIPFRMIHYSKEGGYGKNKQRSREIIWESEDKRYSIFLNENYITFEPN